MINTVRTQRTKLQGAATHTTLKLNTIIAGTTLKQLSRNITISGLFTPGQTRGIENNFKHISKRIFDIAFSASVILLIFPWLLPIVALIIKLESPGSIFFRQERSGKNGKRFYCLKFRSMFINKQSDAKQATKEDARITRFGAFMRKTSIDELPQFFNVLIGDMSIVGPRPHMLRHTMQYGTLIPAYKKRLNVKPGITGWAQVNGWRGATDQLYKMENRVKYDLVYINNWSFSLDLKCILMTITNNIKGEDNAF